MNLGPASSPCCGEPAAQPVPRTRPHHHDRRIRHPPRPRSRRHQHGADHPRRNSPGPRPDPARRALLQLPRRQGGDPGGGRLPPGRARQDGGPRRRRPLRPRPPRIPALARSRHRRRRRRCAGRVRGRRHPRRRQRPEPRPGDLRRQPALRRGAAAGGRGRPAGHRRPAVADGDPTRGIPAGGAGRRRPERPRHPRPGPGCRHSGGRLRGVRYHRAEPDGSGVSCRRRRRRRGDRSSSRRPASRTGGTCRGDQDGGAG